MILLDGLRERGISLEAAEDRLRLRGPADRLTPELRAEVVAHKTEILAHLRRQQSAEVLESRIRFARSEAELDALVEQIQAGFRAGHLSQVQTERLATLAMDTARQLARGLVNVPAAACLEAS